MVETIICPTNENKNKPEGVCVVMEYSASYQLGDGVAQQMSPEAAAGIMSLIAGFFLIFLVIAIAFYIYFAICLMKIAKKTNTPNGWMAWIPIANVILMLQIAKKPLWWIILFLVPIVNIVFGVLVWMAIAKELKKPEWLGAVLMLAPLASIIPVIGTILGIGATVGIIGYLAFSKNESPAPAAPQA